MPLRLGEDVKVQRNNGKFFRPHSKFLFFFFFFIILFLNIFNDFKTIQIQFSKFFIFHFFLIIFKAIQSAKIEAIYEENGQTMAVCIWHNKDGRKKGLVVNVKQVFKIKLKNNYIFIFIL